MKNFFLSVFFLFVLTTNAQAQWQRVETLPTWTFYGGSIDALGDDFAVFTVSQTRILITTDAGKTWTSKNLPDFVADISLASKNIFYIACGSGKFYKTTDGGNTWATFFSNPSLSSFGNYVEMFSETKGMSMGDGPSSSLNNGLFLKTTNGIDWQQTCFQPVGFSGDTWHRLDFVDENVGYFYRTSTTVGQEKLLKTTDGGASWTTTNFSGRAYGVKFYNKDYGLVCNYDFNTSTNFVDRTIDGGSNWQRFNTAGSQRGAEIEFIPGAPSSVWLGTASGLYFSADSGMTWTRKISTDRIDDVVFPTANTGWALSPTGNLYYTNSVGVITNASQENSLPAAFQLYQNYPNPFNPETIIRYQLSKFSFVTLKVYDLLGREITTLINEFKQPGIHNSTFNINNYSLPSGTYFYRLTAGDFSSTQKMVLLK